MTTTVYHSSRDQNSRQFLSKMRSVPGLEEAVTLIDVQTSGRKIPAYVISIPSVVIPAEKRVLVGSKAFDWIETRRQGASDANGGLMCYDQGGMGGSSALCFAFLEGDGYVCSQQGFCDLAEAAAASTK
jgi:hypothetical protein